MIIFPLAEFVEEVDVPLPNACGNPRKFEFGRAASSN
jgi:hypothetical protein